MKYKILTSILVSNIFLFGVDFKEYETTFNDLVEKKTTYKYVNILKSGCLNYKREILTSYPTIKCSLDLYNKFFIGGYVHNNLEDKCIDENKIFIHSLINRQSYLWSRRGKENLTRAIFRHALNRSVDLYLTELICMEEKRKAIKE